MSRDLKKETEWRKNKYKRFVVDVEKETAEEFSSKLKEDRKSYSEWVKDHINKYLKK